MKRSCEDPPPTGCLKLMPASPCMVREQPVILSGPSKPHGVLQVLIIFSLPTISFPGSMSSPLCATLKLSPAAGGTAVTAAPHGVSPVQRETTMVLGGMGHSEVKRRSLLNWERLRLTTVRCKKRIINLWSNLLIFFYFSCIIEAQRHGCMRCSAAPCERGKAAEL